MNKIEERAKRYATIPTAPWEDPVIDYIAQRHYYLGAFKQREIDINRAWQWMRNHIKLIGSEMELHSSFVKAMMDETDE